VHVALLGEGGRGKGKPKKKGEGKKETSENGGQHGQRDAAGKETLDRGLATISRLHKNIGLICTISYLL